MKCHLCDRDIWDSAYNFDGKDFHGLCRIYYKYPTKEDYLRSLHEESD